MNIDKILDNFNDEKTACTFRAEEVQKNLVQAVLPYLIPLLFFLPLIADKEKRSEFCRFHANQQFTWFLVTVVLGIIENIIGIIPILGGIVNAVINIAELVIAVALMYGASKGKALRLPFVGEMINIF
ncbi:MAG: hypothetical protein NC177_09565 [Ruminococcus flavefaciens]|nr:hypothetical protein [Ruminococcus flavefaciens]